MRSNFRILFLTSLLFLSACTSLRTRETGRGQKPKPPTAAPAPMPGAPVPTITETPMEETAPHGEDAPHVEIPTQVPPPPNIPKVGLILGPGGARAFAHIGVLQEFQREKIPVVAVGGIEWGATVAALYSGKGLANEAEWQMSKLKEEELRQKSLMGAAKPADIKGLNEFLRLSFGKAKAEDGRLPFACPAYNLAKNQVFLMSRGSFDQLLPYCLAYPPVFKPWQGNVAAVREVKMLADHLRSRGATVIVLVNVLPAPSPSRPVSGEEGSAEAVLWNEISAFYAKPVAGVDHALNIPLGAQTVMSFDGKRELLQKGSENGAPLVRVLARRLGL